MNIFTKLTIGILALLAPVAYVLSGPREATVFYDKDSSLWVHEKNGLRCLYGENPSDATYVHGCTPLDMRNLIALQYLKAFLGALYINPDPKNVLDLGLGAGTLPKALNYVVPNAYIDIVEINPVVLDIASRFFGFKESAHIKVHIADALLYESDKMYDIINVDIFGSKGAITEAFSTHFIKKLSGMLTENGVLVFNLVYSKNLPDYKDLLLRGSALFSTQYVIEFNGQAVVLFTNVPYSAKTIEELERKFCGRLKNINIKSSWLRNAMLNGLVDRW